MRNLHFTIEDCKVELGYNKQIFEDLASHQLILFENSNHISQQTDKKQQENPFLDSSGAFPRMISEQLKGTSRESHICY